MVKEIICVRGKYYKLTTGKNPITGEQARFYVQCPAPAEKSYTFPEGKCANSFLIGADPEFVLIDPVSGAIVPTTVNGPRGVVGYDHNGYVAEVRPAPAHTVKKLLENIRDAMGLRCLEPFRRLRWKAGAVYRTNTGSRTHVTLGGHMHIDLEPRGRKHKARLAALDKLVQVYESLDILPKTECETRRELGHAEPRGLRYGSFADFRESVSGEDDGGCPKYKWEYRTLPSWLYDQHVAQAVLTGCKLGVVEPELTTALKLGDPKGLRELYEKCKGQDDDAQRVVDTFEVAGLKGLQGNPAADLKKVWEVPESSKNEVTETYVVQPAVAITGGVPGGLFTATGTQPMWQWPPTQNTGNDQ